MNNRERLQCLFDAFVAGDQATQESLFHPDFSITESEGLPYAGTYHGIAGWWALIEKIVSTYTEFSTQPLEIIGAPDGDRFAALHRLQGRVVATGKLVDQQIFELWVFKDEKVITVRPFYWDTNAVARACMG
jgi:ketosteroid isomerase-like protein